METTAELILKGHFSQLKDKVNKEAIPKEDGMKEKAVTLLNQTFYYLKKQQAVNRLDAEGLELYQQMEKLLVDINKKSDVSVPDKLPMRKAKGRQSKENQRKTGT